MIRDFTILRPQFFIDSQVSEDFDATIELSVLIMRDLIDIDKITVFAISYQDILSCTLDMDIRGTTLKRKVKNLIPISDGISNIHLYRESKKLRVVSNALEWDHRYQGLRIYLATKNLEKQKDDLHKIGVSASIRNKKIPKNLGILEYWND